MPDGYRMPPHFHPTDERAEVKQGTLLVGEAPPRTKVNASRSGGLMCPLKVSAVRARLPGRSPLMGRPVAVMGASPSQIGTARAQLHLRQLLAHVQARILPPPELLVPKVHEKFDDGLRLKDEGTRKLLGDLLVRFSRWIGRERAAAEAERKLLEA
jgi:hypothetical protein